ncbi:MAG: M2 family metallopeptidase [Acidobacteriaceae bacterium]
MRKRVISTAILLILSVGLPLSAQTKSKASAKPTVADAEKFMNDTEAQLLDLSIKAGRASWVQSNFITDDTEALAADANERYIEATTKIARDIKRYDGLKLPPVLARKFLLLKLQLFSLSNPKERAEYATLASGLEGSYGKGKACLKEGKNAGKCLPIGEVEQVFAESRDPEELKQVWTAWHEVGMAKDSSGETMRKRYARFIELQNKGAQELGYKDMGAMWRAGYDMSPEQFSAEVERIWNQVRLLYESLHAYARTQLIKKYGPQAVTKGGLIRADLLGNPWAQQWNNVYPLLAPPTTAKGYDLTEILKEKKIDELGMVHYGENFFKSLGFEPLPQTFWERSLFIKPRDREVVCHASAWSIDFQNDLRLKMCILIRDEDFVTVHHELGHNFYQRAYNKQPYLFQSGANDGFHEAIGDTVALSITPDYLKQVGLLETIPQTDDTDLLMHRALDKVAFLPFGLLIDQWRWKVFSGEVSPADYNKAWWQLREKYQGIAPPAVRTENDFDPGAKYHVPGNTPYTRYFLAAVLQFQFYRAMCREAGYTGALHRCSFYGNKEAGEKFAKMLEMGQSQPWPEALKALTGEDRMDGNAMMEYFAPLKKWLDEQNAAANAKPGWTLPADPLAGPAN